jgi:hypothetical protein
MVTTVNCPTCQKTLTWSTAEKWKPFCSERCKLIDLGDWATENHKIAGEPAHQSTSDSNQDYH